jgi:hypothetical protein
MAFVWGKDGTSVFICEPSIRLWVYFSMCKWHNTC